MTSYAGWVLGSAESVAIVVCVGFAVDYVVHLATHYVHSRHKQREPRIQEALQELGISILSGSMTTVLATLPLFMPVLLMFNKFGVYVIATVLFSLYYSVAFFAALCMICGPEGDFGNMSLIYSNLLQRCGY